MKTFMITVIIGALGYYIFFYEPSETQKVVPANTSDQELRDEYGIENKAYEGAFTETYDKLKGSINSAKEAVSLTEQKSKEASQI